MVSPKIFEYDTLSSDDKWDETYDVIMANPPFMTPKGGINPHKRFSVMANRAEVLFVDYIKEHLRTNGRAGVIVPEGIIFQSGTAYKQLRKQLVDESYLWAVVSLPAGVFQPYSGVKTSILFFDRALAKLSDSIVFMKISNDGYDLGAQRRKIEGDDLPTALMLLNSYKKNIVSQNLPQTSELETLTKNTISIFVPKSKIKNFGDYYLAGERYKEINETKNQKWPMVKLGDNRYFKIESGGTPSSTKPEYWNGEIFWATLVDLPASNFITNITNTQRKITQSGLKNSSAKLLPKYSVLVSTRATIGRVGINLVELATNQGFKNIIINDTSKVDYRFVALMLTQLVEQMESIASGGTFKELSKTNFAKLQVPMPPLDVQKKVIEEIESYQKIVVLASEMTQVKGINISIDPSWQRISLDDLATIRYGYTASARDTGDTRFIRITDVNEYGELNPNNQRFITLDEESKKYLLKKGDVLVARTGATFGKTMIFKEDYSAIFASYLIRLQFDESKILPEFYWCYAQTKDYWNQANRLVTGGGQPQFNGNVLKSIQVPLPTLEKQKEIASEFLKIRSQLVNQNLELIKIFKEKIQLAVDNI